MQTEPEEEAVCTLLAMKSICKDRAFKNLRKGLFKNITKTVGEEVFLSSTSSSVSAMALCETLALILGRSIASVAELLSHCPMLKDESENYNDLFRRAIVDALVEGVTGAVRESARDFLFNVDKDLKEANLRE